MTPAEKHEVLLRAYWAKRDADWGLKKTHTFSDWLIILAYQNAFLKFWLMVSWITTACALGLAYAVLFY